MNAIFSVDENWGIGYRNKLLFRASGDMKHFRRMTTGKVVIMGYNTLLSLPGGKPLPGRENVVLSRKPGLQVEGALVCASVERLLDRLSGREPDELFVMGGEEVYRQLLPLCERAYVTKFHASARADRFLPDLDASPQWVLEDEGERNSEDGLEYTMCTYRRRAEYPKQAGQALG